MRLVSVSDTNCQYENVRCFPSLACPWGLRAARDGDGLHDDSSFGIRIRPNLTPDICANPCQKFPPRAAAVLTSLALFAESPTIAISLAPARGFTLIQSV